MGRLLLSIDKLRSTESDDGTVICIDRSLSGKNREILIGGGEAPEQLIWIVQPDSMQFFRKRLIAHTLPQSVMGISNRAGSRYQTKNWRFQAVVGEEG